MMRSVAYDGDAELRIANDGSHVLLTIKRTGARRVPRWWRWLFGVAVTDELRLDPSDAWRMAQGLCDAAHSIECRGGCARPATVQAEQVH